MQGRGWLLATVVVALTACGDDDGAPINKDAAVDASRDAETDASDAGVDGRVVDAAPDALSGEDDAQVELDARVDDASVDASDAGDGGTMISRVPGFSARPANPTCVAWEQDAEPPAALSLTGCFDPQHPDQPVAALIPFEPIAKLWSDNAAKQRWFAIPDGTSIVVQPDGDFDMPNGSVLVKTFSVFDKKIETRLLVRHPNGVWAGYAYQWDDAGTDAQLLSDDDYLSDGKRLLGLGGGQQSWTIPSRNQCARCHVSAAGFSLGLEVAQLNSTLHYPASDLDANQLVTLNAIGMFDTAQGIAEPYEDLPKLSAFTGNDPLALRARSYLHVNCSMCHRGATSSCTGDFRFQTPEAQMGVCNTMALSSSMWTSDARIIKPGDPEQSVMALRMRAPSANDFVRMPPLGTEVLDHQGINMIEAWIRTMESCPQ